jgi:hypothetical protein
MAPFDQYRSNPSRWQKLLEGWVHPLGIILKPLPNPRFADIPDALFGNHTGKYICSSKIP